MLRTLRSKVINCSRASVTLWQTPVRISIIDCMSSAETFSMSSSLQAARMRGEPGASSPVSRSRTAASISMPTVGSALP